MCKFWYKFDKEERAPTYIYIYIYIYIYLYNIYLMSASKRKKILVI